MPSFDAPDGTALAYHVLGEGFPLICLPGGPMQDSDYLGELGGLWAHRQLVKLDLRGTGQSAKPADVTSYRCDRQVEDVEALRVHLGRDQIDVLAHSAGANLAALYVARYPERVGRLVLVTPSTRAVAIDVAGESRLEIARLRRDEPWFDAASAALSEIVADGGTAEDWKAIEPFYYGRWDATAQAHLAAQEGHWNEEAAAVFGADGVFDPDALRAALTTFAGPALLLVGAVDLNPTPSAAAEFAGLFPAAELVIQPLSGHYPWIDDPDQFVASITAFLNR